MRKYIFITIISVVVFTLSGCSSAKIDQLNDTVIQLQNDNEKLKQELEEENKNNEEKSKVIENLESEMQSEKNKYNVLIDDVQLISEEIYKEGPTEGSIFGQFDVSVKLINHSQKDLENVKISVKMETSLGHYPKSLNVKTTKLVTVKTLKASEEKEVIFTGFKVDHPGNVQELIVNVVDHGEIKKIKIPSAFPPGSQD